MSTGPCTAGCDFTMATIAASVFWVAVVVAAAASILGAILLWSRGRWGAAFPFFSAGLVLIVFVVTDLIALVALDSRG